MITAQEINTAYTALASATEDYTDAAELEINSKATLDKAILVATARGQIDGKNEQARLAQARELLADRFALNEAHAADTRRARLILDLARIEVERVRALLRLNELAAANNG